MARDSSRVYIRCAADKWWRFSFIGTLLVWSQLRWELSRYCCPW